MWCGERAEGADRRAELTKRAKSFFEEAVEAQNKGDLKAAISGYNKTLALAPGLALALGYVSALNNLGLALCKGRKLEVVIARYRRALERNPNHAGMVYNFGITLKDAGFVDEALDVLEKARKLNPDLPDIRWDIALGIWSRAIWRTAGQPMSCAGSFPIRSIFVFPNGDGMASQSMRLC